MGHSDATWSTIAQPSRICCRHTQTPAHGHSQGRPSEASHTEPLWHSGTDKQPTSQRLRAQSHKGLKNPDTWNEATQDAKRGLPVRWHLPRRTSQCTPVPTSPGRGCHWPSQPTTDKPERERTHAVTSKGANSTEVSQPSRVPRPARECHWWDVAGRLAIEPAWQREGRERVLYQHQERCT